MALASEDVIKRIDSVLGRYMTPNGHPDRDEFSKYPDGAIGGWLISTMEAIRRFAPPGSSYLDKAEGLGYSAASTLELIAGILQALRSDYSDGLLVDLTELVHADLFDDFLDMSAHLLESGYKDPAAVLAGSVLEEHLRKLAGKCGVPTIKQSGDPEKADTLNANLAKRVVYGKTEQKQVTAWMGLRNDAAHGNYDAYTTGQVEIMVQGVRGFVVRHPA